MGVVIDSIKNEMLSLLAQHELPAELVPLAITFVTDERMSWMSFNKLYNGLRSLQHETPEEG